MPIRYKQPRKPPKITKGQPVTAPLPDPPRADLVTEMQQFVRLAPKRQRVDVRENEISIRQSLQNAQGWNTLLTNLALLGVVAIFVRFGWSNATIPQNFDTRLLSLLALALSALPILYYCLVVLCDDLVVRINANRVKISYQPLPYWGKTVQSSEIVQLYTVSYERPQLNSLQARHKKYETVYAVRAKTERGKDIPLVGGIAYAEEAEYLERIIEKSLGIRDTSSA